eukprot:jgi/Mesvir1/13377/Mv26279-RA.1
MGGWIHVYVCVCVWVRDRRVCVYVCVCVCASLLRRWSTRMHWRKGVMKTQTNCRTHPSTFTKHKAKRAMGVG